MPLHDLAFYFAIFFILGVGAASIGVNIWWAVLLIVIAAIVLFFDPIRDSTSNGAGKNIAIAALTPVALLGFLYFHFYSATASINFVFNNSITTTGIIINDPQYTDKSQKFEIQLQPPHAGKTEIVVATYPRFSYGDKLKITGVLTKANSETGSVMAFPKLELISSGHVNAVKNFLYNVKHSLMANLDKVLPAEKAALGSGLLLGARGGFSDDFKQAMRASGTTHIVALSGYNISLVGIGVMNVLVWFMSRRRAFYFSIAFIILFVLMTGAEASVVRAAIMGIIVMIAERSSRHFDFRNAITLTALMMLIYNPRLLIFSPGFQLSFMALIGLIYLEPWIKKFFGWDSKTGDGIISWRKNLTQTIAAQIGALPIILINFGYFNPLSVIANVLILEFIPITTFFAFAVAVSGFIATGLSLILSLPLSLFLGYEISIINLFGSNWQ